MTEQELRQKLKEAHAEWAVGKIGYTIKLPDHLMPICKAYADAKDTEITELKASLSQAQQMYTDLLVGTTDAIDTKDAEIKRLRDGIKKGFEKLAEIPYCSVLRTIFDNAKGVQNDLESLLSPAPVTETKNEDQE